MVSKTESESELSITKDTNLSLSLDGFSEKMQVTNPEHMNHII